MSVRPARAALTALLGVAIVVATVLAGLTIASAATSSKKSSPRPTTKPTTSSTFATAPSKPRTTTTPKPTATLTPTAAPTTAAPTTAAPTNAPTTAAPTTAPTTVSPTAATAPPAAPTTAAPTTASPTATAPPAAPSPTTRFGMSYGERLSRMTQADLDATLDDAKALGLTMIRADLSWTTVQNGGRTSWDWSGFDRVVAAAKARNLEVLPILTYTPGWARDSSCFKFSCPPRDPNEFAAFATAAVKRYAAYGVKAWEVWNEPNLAQFWPSPNAVRYATLLSTTSTAIKKADPQAKVLLGGLAALESSSTAIGPREYLNSICLTGACATVDAVSFHPYTYPYPASYYATFSAWSKMGATPISLRSILTSFGLETLPIWVTEYGAPTDGDGTAVDGTWASLTSTSTHVTPEWQAEIARDAVERADADPTVETFFWYTNQDLPNTSRREASFGLRRLDGTRKPAWDAYRLAIAAAKAS